MSYLNIENFKYNPLNFQFLSSALLNSVRKEMKQIPYTGYISAIWYNCEESYLEQLEFISNCSFLIAQKMILHLRIISFSIKNTLPFFKFITF